MSSRSESSNEVRETFKLKLTVGHDAILLKTKIPKMTHRWRVFVEGADGDIAPLVDRMVFHLHPSFDHPIREVEKPPFEISESGFGMFTMKIEIFFFGKPIELYYELVLMTNRDVKSVSNKIVSITNPLPYIRKLLLEAGGKSSCESNGVCEENSEVQNPKDVQGCVSSKKKKKSKDDDQSERERKSIVSSKPKPVKTISRSDSCSSLSSLSSLSPANSDEEVKKPTPEKEEVIVEKKKKKTKEKKAPKEKKSEKSNKSKLEKSKSESKKTESKIQSISTQSTPKKVETESREVFSGTSLPKVASFSGLSSKEEKKHKKKDVTEFALFLDKEENETKKSKKERKEMKQNEKIEDRKKKDYDKERNESKDKEKSEVKSSVKDTLSNLFGSLVDEENTNEVCQSSPEAMLTSSPSYQQLGPSFSDAGLPNENVVSFTKASASTSEFPPNEQSVKKKREKRKKDKKGDSEDRGDGSSGRREVKSKHHKKDNTNSQDTGNETQLNSSAEGTITTESPLKVKKKRKREENDQDKLRGHEKKRRYRDYDQDAVEDHSKKLSSPHGHRTYGEASNSRLHKVDVDKTSLEFSKHTNVESSDEGTDQPLWESRSLRNEQMGRVFSSIAVDSSSNADMHSNSANHAAICHLQDDEPRNRELQRSETGMFTPSSNPSLSPRVETQQAKSRKNEDEGEMEEHDTETDARSGHSYNSTIASEVQSVGLDDFGAQNSLSPHSNQLSKSFDDDANSRTSPVQQKVRSKSKNFLSSQNETSSKNSSKTSAIEKMLWERKLESLMKLLEAINSVETAYVIKTMMIEDMKIRDASKRNLAVGDDTCCTLDQLTHGCVNRIFQYLTQDDKYVD